MGPDMALEVNRQGSLAFVEHRIHVSAGHRVALVCLGISLSILQMMLSILQLHTEATTGPQVRSLKWCIQATL